LILLIVVITGLSTFSQTPSSSKPWTEWTKKDVEKILNDSAWGQTQTTGGGSASSDAPAITKTQGAGNETISRTGESGESSGPKPINFRARFLTAKPVREAFARMAILARPNPEKDFVDQLQGFIDRDFGNYLVVVLSIDSADARVANVSMMSLSKMT